MAQQRRFGHSAAVTDSPADTVAEDFPVELEAPDIAPWAEGNTGIPYVTRLDGGAPGPEVLVCALTHGNELCGAVVLDTLLRRGLRPRRGRLTLAFANPAAYARFDPAEPSASRFVDEDLNRLWSPAVLAGPRRSVERDRARALRPVVEAADLLLDLHSMQLPGDPLMLAGPLAKGRDLACRVGYPGLVICDSGHAAGPRMRDYGGFADPGSPKNALLAECGQHWAADSAAVALETTLRFLAAAGSIDETDATAVAPLPPRPAPRVIEVTDAVTAATDRFAFARPFAGLEVIERAGSLLGRDGEREIRTPHDRCVLVMPSRRVARGHTAVRLGRYVR